MKSSPKEQAPRRPDRSVIRDLCAKAQQDRRFGILLEACLTDPVTSKVLLLHKTELFPRLELPIEGLTVTIAAGGLPFLSHTPKQIRRTLKLLATKYAAFSRQPERSQEGEQRMESAQSAVSESLQD